MAAHFFGNMGKTNVFSTLPQLCCRCRNRDIGGKLKAPDQGQFFRSKKYNRPPVWVCHDCLRHPVRQRRPGQESPAEREVSIALQVFGEWFIPEHQLGPFIYDFAFPKLKLLMEVDSWTWHHSRNRRVRDGRKASFAREAGWEFFRLKIGPKLGWRACYAVRAMRLWRIKETWGDDVPLARTIYSMTYGGNE
jgi:hypothetical protein